MFFVYLFIIISLTFFSLSVLGLYRFPDSYTRLHSSGLSTTFGFIFFALSTIFYLLPLKTNPSLIAHIIIIALLLLAIEPVTAHLISRTAYKNGVKPKGAVVDKLSKG